jgi:hypothetical protein
MVRRFTTWTGIALACAIGVSLTGFAPANDPIDEVPEGLQGFVFVANETVYNSDLTEVASIEEYVDAYKEAGVAIDDEQAHATSIAGTDLGDAPRFATPAEFEGADLTEAPGCSGHDQNRSLQRFSRTAKGGAPRGIADLRCGGTTWGLRHIDRNHRAHWANKVAGSGRTWDEFARWAMGSVLSAPAAAPYNSSNNTYGYQAPIQVWVNGKLKTQFNTLVSVSNGDNWRIITAFPLG